MSTYYCMLHPVSSRLYRKSNTKNNHKSSNVYVALEHSVWITNDYFELVRHKLWALKKSNIIGLMASSVLISTLCLWIHKFWMKLVRFEVLLYTKCILGTKWVFVGCGSAFTLDVSRYNRKKYFLTGSQRILFLSQLLRCT